MKPLDEEPGEGRERRTLARWPRGRDRGRDCQELHARREALGARRAPVLGALDHHRPGEDRPQAHAAAPLGLDQRRREWGQRRRPRRRRHRPVGPEPQPVKDALPEPAEPAVQRREVDRREPRRRTAEPLGRLEVTLPRRAHDRHGVRLPRHEVGRQDPRAPPARLAVRQRNLDLRLATAHVLLAGEDRPSLDPASREAQANRAAARAGREPQPVRHRAAALTKVGEERNMQKRHDRRNGFGGRKAGRSRFVGGRQPPPLLHLLSWQDPSRPAPGVSPRVRESESPCGY